MITDEQTYKNLPYLGNYMKLSPLLPGVAFETLVPSASTQLIF